MRVLHEWDDWESSQDWERFVLAFNEQRRPKTSLGVYAVRNLIAGFVICGAVVLVASWLR